MKKYNLKATFWLFASFSLFISACGNGDNNQIKNTDLSSSEMESVSKLDTIQLTLNSDDRMKFDQSELSVFEGQTVVLTLVHTGTMPVTAMGHNFVLLTQGTSISDFAKEALNAKENEYIPKDQKDVIAHTNLIGGGESTKVTFNAPAKGEYDFLCSFPGHYSIMKGKFIVK